ncbi:hypothetical protein FPSE_05363 [Fusarium pseudograminearum CS3096]|uniref:Enoyl reductase (ER) domain-containing protein n=1 Tax=Fusarium pseudograminearum (strain CS3096) TaxID=1028729 RepID=K3VLZ4_FUSPC|nr:hypothetical protein FPSE_05363 [Fusarium pseudograminearum CS3096]EKJ74613.1 hypothetical protein FPSE_05363 [Fusarium pseudograminearum CS3096]
MESSNTIPLTMKAAQWRTIRGGIERNLKFSVDAKLPKDSHSLANGHTLVKVAYASVNHLDYKVAEMPLASMFFTKPVTPGLDYSGTIISTTLEEFGAGHRVFGRTELPTGGTMAEYVVVGEKGLAAVPDGVSLRDAACVGICGTTNVQYLASVIKTGDKVFINGGSGGVGTFAIQVAKAMGCLHITTTCSASNSEFCHALGADETIDYRSENVLEILKNREEQFDLVYDTIFSNPSLYWQSHNYLKPHGSYICVGLPSIFQFIKTFLSIKLLPRWLGGGKRTFKFQSVVANRQDFEQMAEWIREEKVKVVVEEGFVLEDADRAYASLKGGRTRGKIVVRIGGEPDGEQ